MDNLEELEKGIRDMQSLVTLMNSELKELNKEVKEVSFPYNINAALNESSAIRVTTEGDATDPTIALLPVTIEGAKTYLDMFCKKSNTAKQYVQKWMPIVAASQSVKGNEKEREFLLSWANVVDYE